MRSWTSRRPGLRVGLAAGRLADRGPRARGSRTARAARRVPRELPDWRDEDVVGSPSPSGIQRHGTSAATRRWPGCANGWATRLKLMLDFVPNHMAPDHPWVKEHPSTSSPAPRRIWRASRRTGGASTGTRAGRRVLAFGRDPYFPGWPDALQLNYRHGGLREARSASSAGRRAVRWRSLRHGDAGAAGVFQRTWGDRALPRDGSPPVDQPFWPEAIGASAPDPDFVFMAEVYWDMEWELQQAGFAYTYDKRLYDRLVAGHAGPVREHLGRRRSSRTTRCASSRTTTSRARGDVPAAGHAHGGGGGHLPRPGCAFFHEGQLQGRKAHVSMHLGRRPAEPLDPEMVAFYERLLGAATSRGARGDWQLRVRPAWDGNPTYEQIIVGLWEMGERRLMMAVNYGASQAQCYFTSGMTGHGGAPVHAGRPDGATPNTNARATISSPRSVSRHAAVGLQRVRAATHGVKRPPAASTRRRRPFRYMQDGAVTEAPSNMIEPQLGPNVHVCVPEEIATAAVDGQRPAGRPAARVRTVQASRRERRGARLVRVHQRQGAIVRVRAAVSGRRQRDVAGGTSGWRSRRRPGPRAAWHRPW